MRRWKRLRRVGSRRWIGDCFDPRISYNHDMVTIDLNLDRRWDELFRCVEGGEIVRVVRGDRDVAVVQPAGPVAEDEAFLKLLAETGAEQIAKTFPADEYAEWDKAEKKNGTR